MVQSARFVDVSVGYTVMRRREELGLAPGTVARQAGLSEATLDECENGRRAFEPRHIVELANILDVTPGWFFSGL